MQCGRPEAAGLAVEEVNWQEGRDEPAATGKGTLDQRRNVESILKIPFSARYNVMLFYLPSEHSVKFVIIISSLDFHLVYQVWSKYENGANTGIIKGVKLQTDYICNTHMSICTYIQRWGVEPGSTCTKALIVITP